MKHCVFCGSTIQRPITISFIFSFQGVKKSVVCENCFKQFDDLKNHSTCPGCSKKQEEQTLCVDCVKWKNRCTEFSLNHKALFDYNEIARQFMKQYKNQGDVVLGSIFSEPVAAFLKNKTKTHTIVPIPLSQTEKEARGFNQVEVLLKQAGILYKNCLIHRGDGEEPSRITQAKELQTMQPFQLTIQKGEILEKPFLIVDDVYTTGRTLYQARVLLETCGKTETFSLFR